jgi:hypothetical protein
MVPRAVKAVVLVFPYGEALARRNAEDERIAKEGGPKVDGSVFWVKQTVSNVTALPSEIVDTWNTADSGRLRYDGVDPRNG